MTTINHATPIARERDDLLAALKDIVAAADQSTRDGWSGGQTLDALLGHAERARAAIATAEGGA